MTVDERAAPRFALVVDTPALERWQLASVERLAETAVVALVIVLPNGAPRRHRRGLRRVALAGADLGRRWPVVVIGDGAEAWRAATAGVTHVLRFTSRPLPEPCAPRVWSLRVGAGGDEPMFWELLRGAATVTVQLLEQRAGASAVLREGVFGVAPRRQDLRRSVDLLLDEVAHWPAAAVRRGAVRQLPAEPPAPASVAPTRYQQAAFALRRALVGARRVQRALTEYNQWRVGLIAGDAAAVCFGGGSSCVRWLDLPARDVAADPFVLGHDGAHVVMYERLDRLSGQKVIWWGRVEADGRVSDAAPAQGLPDYASYPNTFRLEGEYLCVPEAHRENEVAVYRARAFPFAWEKAHVLVGGRQLLDPTLVRHDGRWWLFCTDRRRGANFNLFLWYADRLEGPWHEHPANPVRTDIGSARPAGPLFIHQGQLYRPAQDCSIRYGRRVVVQAVERLDPERFEEVTARVVEPPDRVFGDGFHTLCGTDGVTVIDGRRTGIRWPLAGRRLTAVGRQPAAGAT